MRNISFILILFSFFSCEKVIDVDLNESVPQIFIEANLQASEEEFIVDIAETTSYFDNQSAVKIKDAEVQLIDEDGTIISIPWNGSGQYSATVEAISNQTYTLEVRIGEQLYQATSFLPKKVELIALETEFQEARGPLDGGYLLYFSFRDDGTVNNYYRLLHRIDGVLQNGGEDLQVVDDSFFDGGIARLPMFRKTFNTDETIEVILRHFDAASFDYFNSLSDIVSSENGGPTGGSAAPGNPNTNWDNGALGYFSAFSADTLSIKIP